MWMALLGIGFARYEKNLSTLFYTKNSCKSIRQLNTHRKKNGYIHKAKKVKLKSIWKDNEHN